MTFAATLWKSILWAAPVVFVLSVVEHILKLNDYPALAAQVNDISNYAAGFIGCWWWKKYMGY